MIDLSVCTVILNNGMEIEIISSTSTYQEIVSDLRCRLFWYFSYCVNIFCITSVIETYFFSHKYVLITMLKMSTGRAFKRKYLLIPKVLTRIKNY